MRSQEPRLHSLSRSARLSLAAAVVMCLGLIGAARSAEAAYEQVGNFAGTAGALQPINTLEQNWPEEVQLGGTGGLAVNYTGAGGVPAGTIYAATSYATVVRFNPDGSFSERWTFAGNPTPQQRCGPEGDPATPTCSSQKGAQPGVVDVAVDQSTGNVYAYVGSNEAGNKLVHVYVADGTELISEFAEKAPSEETMAESPSKIHFATYPSSVGPLAVDEGGNAYIRDEDQAGNRHHRFMKFEPESPGDYAHYVYAGQNHDFSVGEKEGPAHPVTDAAGYVYAQSANENAIYKFDPNQPNAEPVCDYTFSRAGIETLTVNPDTGEVFFWTYKDRTHLYRLNPCVGGKFTEGGTVQFSPARAQGNIGGLALDPVRVYEAGRPPGVLYMAATTGEGGKTEGSYPDTKVESSLGYIFTQPNEIPPVVASEAFSHVTAGSALVKGEVNPKGSATDYVIQYETESQYQANDPSDRFAGAEESPIGGGFVGEGTKPVAVSAALAGLEPGTAYRVRIVASSHCSAADEEKVCETAGEGFSFTTYPQIAPGLPDQRGYELVSPPDKEGGQVIPAEPFIYSCSFQCKPGTYFSAHPMKSNPGGNGVVYEGTAFDSETSALRGNEYIARRNPSSGWETVNLSPTQLTGFSAGGASSAGGYLAFDSDLNKGVLFQQGPTLSPDAPENYQNLYLQSTGIVTTLTPLLGQSQVFHRPAEGSGHLELFYGGASADFTRIFFVANDALTDSSAFAPEAIDGGANKQNLYEWHEGKLSLVNVFPGNTTTQPGASFGVFGGNPISEDGSRAFFSDEAGQAYVREDGESTRAIETEGIPDPGEFLVASKDGSEVLLANGHLHHLDGELLTIDLTQGKGGFLGVVGQANDLSRIYFVDTAVLDETVSPQGEVAESGKNNLYAWTEGGDAHFVAQLLSNDNQESGGPQSRKDWSRPSQRTAEASPNGRFLAFVSAAPLTGRDNTGLCGGPCQQAFLYDGSTDRLACASCDPSGEKPLGATFLPRVRGAQEAQAHYLTDSGRLLFDSRDSIVPADVNDGVEDVYEYEPKGVGSCLSEFADGGCVSLISAGTGAEDSNFQSMDSSGGNVFFTTRDQLRLKDKDELIDLYDARENGGIASETEASGTGCQGEACQPPVIAPNDPTPASSAFQGPGNVKESKAKKKQKHKMRKHKKHRRKKHGHQHKKRHAKSNHGGAK